MVKSSPASIYAVQKALRMPGETLKEFGDAWKSLPDKDKDDLRQWVADEKSLTHP